LSCFSSFLSSFPCLPVMRLAPGIKHCCGFHVAPKSSHVGTWLPSVVGLGESVHEWLMLFSPGLHTVGCYIKADPPLMLSFCLCPIALSLFYHGIKVSWGLSRCGYPVVDFPASRTVSKINLFSL
jgi:hypothetical protein